MSRTKSVLSAWIPCAAAAVCLAGPAAAQAPAAAAPPAVPNVRVSNLAYLQYSASLSDRIGHANNFDVTRAYITVLGKFENGVSTRVTADIYRPADGTLTYRIKYAYAAWNPSGSAYTLKLGAIHTPWLDWEETLWDYRFQGPMAMERAGYMVSSDLGAAVDGNYGMDHVNFQATVVNGEGYTRPGGDKGKDVQARASVRLMPTNDSTRVGGLRVTAYGQYGKLTGGGPRNRWIGLVSYRSKMVTLAGEAAATKDRLASGANADGRILSAYGVAHFGVTPWAFVARVDHVDPNKNVANDAVTTLIVGPSYQIAKPLRVLLDLDHSSYQQAVLTQAQQAAKTRLMLQAQISF